MSDITANAITEKTVLKAGTIIVVNGEKVELAEDAAITTAVPKKILSEIVSIDDKADILTVNTVKFSGDLIRGLADTLQIGQTFMITERKDGVITVIQ